MSVIEDPKSMACSMRNQRRLPLYGEKSRGGPPSLATATRYAKDSSYPATVSGWTRYQYVIDGNFHPMCQKVTATRAQWNKGEVDERNIYTRDRWGDSFSREVVRRDNKRMRESLKHGKHYDFSVV